MSDRRASFAERGVVRQLVDRLIEHGALPEPEEYEVRWPEVRDLDLAERVQIAVGMADVNQKAGETVVTADEIRDRVLDLPPLEEVSPADVEEGLDETEPEVIPQPQGEEARAARPFVRRRGALSIVSRIPGSRGYAR